MSVLFRRRGCADVLCPQQARQRPHQHWQGQGEPSAFRGRAGGGAGGRKNVRTRRPKKLRSKFDQVFPGKKAGTTLSKFQAAGLGTFEHAGYGAKHSVEDKQKGFFYKVNQRSTESSVCIGRQNPTFFCGNASRSASWLRKGAHRRVPRPTIGKVQEEGVVVL